MRLSFIKNLYRALFLSTLCFMLQAMEQGLSKDINKLKLSSQETATADVKSIKPFTSQPFDHIPQYAYENCNQGTKHTWSSEYFEKLKKAVQKLTKETVHKKYPKEEYTKNAEEYDWIYGLSLIEANYLKKPCKLSVDDLKKINGCLSRLIVGNDGAFREQRIVWPKQDGTPAESFFPHYIRTYEQGILNGTDPFLKLIVEKRSDNSESHLFNTDAVKAFLTHFKDTARFADNGAEVNIKLDPEEALAWEKECAELPDHKTGTINFSYWYKKRHHIFPNPSAIETELKTTLRKIERIKNPIEAATRLWYEIVRIHPWLEANKRTGKALASLILLKNGYLPPLIMDEDGKEYVQAFMQGFGKEDGHIKFIQFIARLIDKTQNQFKGATL